MICINKEAKIYIPGEEKITNFGSCQKTMGKDFLEDLNEAQQQAVIDRDLTKLIELGGNIYYLVKITSADGLSVAHAVSLMTDLSHEAYLEMMKNGGRSPEGNRYIGENSNG